MNQALISFQYNYFPVALEPKYVYHEIMKCIYLLHLKDNMPIINFFNVETDRMSSFGLAGLFLREFARAQR